MTKETGKETIRWCTYNIIHHGQARLQQAIKCSETMNIDFGMLTETKIVNDMYPRTYNGYNILATTASNHQGGVALFWRESNKWTKYCLVPSHSWKREVEIYWNIHTSV